MSTLFPAFPSLSAMLALMFIGNDGTDIDPRSSRPKGHYKIPSSFDQKPGHSLSAISPDGWTWTGNR